MPKAPKEKTTRPRIDPLAGPGPSNNGNHFGDSNGVVTSSSAPDMTTTSSAASASSGYLLWAYLPTMSPPCISRMLRVPPHLTFTELHEVLQIAFSWTDSHAYSFKVNTIADKPSKRNRWDPDPTPVMTLQMDAYAIDDSMLRPEEAAKMRACGAVTLDHVFERPEWRELGVNVEYRYDFGDNWEHQIQFLGAAEPHLSKAMGQGADQKIFCFGGEGHPCVEDCGSYGGFEELKVSETHSLRMIVLSDRFVRTCSAIPKRKIPTGGENGIEEARGIISIRGSGTS